jgi:predicted nucleotidyltransferase
MEVAVKNKAELINRIMTNSYRLRQFGVLEIGVFGSFVKDQANEKSDVDFYVDIAPKFKTLKNFTGLADTLEEITGRKIELVTPQSLSKYIGPFILKEVEYVPLSVAR